MELNHEYQNRYIRGIIQAINASIDRGGISTLDFEQIVYDASGDPNGKIGQEFLYDFLESCFFENLDGKRVRPQKCIKIELLPTGAEMQWLLHVLQSPLASLFLDEPERRMLLNALQKAGIPDLMRHIQTYGFAEPELPDTAAFRAILSAIRAHRYLQMTNHAKNGNIYRDQTVIPMKLEYGAVTGKWYLSFSPADGSRPVKAVLSALSDISAGAVIPEEKRPDLRRMMQAKRAEPLILRVYPEMNTPARAIAFFSQYDTTVVRTDDGGLRMQIQYYVFDEETLLRQIIGFGPYVQVLSPEPAVGKMRDYLRKLPY